MTTSEWDSSYWIDQLATLADQKSIEKIYYNKNSDVLVDVDETHSNIPQPSHTTTINSSQDPFSLDNWSATSALTSPTISFPHLAKAENKSVDTSGVTIRFSELMTNAPSESPKMLRINCSLTDLITGTGDIQKAIEDIKKGNKVDEKRETVSFASLVKEEKELQKQRDSGLNVTAAEFSVKFKKELPKKTGAGLRVTAKEFSITPPQAPKFNVAAKEFTSIKNEEWKARVNAEEFVFQPNTSDGQKQGSKGTDVNGTVFYPYVPSKQK
ncbi:hypothetical protein EDC96DRAFT_494083 [Choanephora cucurbitarum]|nr:hypothetical protein EDC96DRAFT_494083 [Choanephora cucurbitarum]